MRTPTLSAVLIAVILMAAAAAQPEVPWRTHCDGASSNVEIGACLARELRTADAALNAAYQAALAGFAAGQGSEAPSARLVSARARLREARRPGSSGHGVG